MLRFRRLFTKQNCAVATRILSSKPKQGVAIRSDCTDVSGREYNISSQQDAKKSSSQQASAFQQPRPENQSTESHSTLQRYFSKLHQTNRLNTIPTLNTIPALNTVTLTKTPFSSQLQVHNPFSPLNIQCHPYVTCIDNPASITPDPVTGITPKMTVLLKCLAVAIKPEQHTHGVNMFMRLFETDRSIQRMFSKFPCDDICALENNPDFNSHVDKFMKAFLYCLEVSGSVPDLKSNLALQNKIHKNLHIPDKHFITLGHVINEYLKETLGAKYSEDVECAIAYFWRFVVMEMTAKPGVTKCATCGATIVKEDVISAQKRK